MLPFSGEGRETPTLLALLELASVIVCVLFVAATPYWDISQAAKHIYCFYWSRNTFKLLSFHLPF
jgi:hypothetical protein